MAYVPVTMALECAQCGWRPAESLRQDVAQMHFKVDHDTSDMHFNLSVICPCGKTMNHVETQPTGGGWFDIFQCPDDGSQGRVKRNDNPTQGDIDA